MSTTAQVSDAETICPEYTYLEGMCLGTVPRVIKEVQLVSSMPTLWWRNLLFSPSAPQGNSLQQNAISSGYLCITNNNLLSAAN
jgi:hypothetical protein